MSEGNEWNHVNHADVIIHAFISTVILMCEIYWQELKGTVAKGTVDKS